MRTRTIVGAVVLALLLAVTSVNLSFAQDPTTLPENHYKVYLSSPIPIARPIELQDQFGIFTVTDLVFDKFATPAEKRHLDGTTYPMFDAAIHMDWWRIFAPQPTRTLIGTDQFGKAAWVVKDARYLLTPSLKNTPTPPPPVPVWNHYVCYEALSGPYIGEYVYLIDQFGNAYVQVLQPKYFCNPAQKLDEGNIYPIVEPTVHLACYQVQNPDFTVTPITALDQFGFWQTQLYENDCLCVPALKDYPLRTEQSTWGRVKALYRN
jgi:hypothetical protein